MSVHEEFIRSEIMTGHTMLNLAATGQRVGEHDAASNALQNAKNALATAKRFLPFTAAHNTSYEQLALGIEELQQAVEQHEQTQGLPGENSNRV